jgi:Oxidoreductase family, NAD-binding Rossmann fold
MSGLGLSHNARLDISLQNEISILFETFHLPLVSLGVSVLSQLVCISISHLPRRCCNEEGETVTEGRNSGLRTYFAGRASRCLPQSTQCGTLRHLRPAKDLVEKIASRFEPRKTFTDYDAMLADPKVEAVVVAITDQFHVDAAIRAFESR